MNEFHASLIGRNLMFDALLLMLVAFLLVQLLRKSRERARNGVRPSRQSALRFFHAAFDRQKGQHNRA